LNLIDLYLIFWEKSQSIQIHSFEVNMGGNFTHPPTSAKTVLYVSKKLSFSELTHLLSPLLM
jgi:hypothetical protein